MENENHLRLSKSRAAASSKSGGTNLHSANFSRPDDGLFRLRKICVPIQHVRRGDPFPLKPPLDPFPYPRDPRSRPADATLPDGLYAFVQDDQGVVWVVPDGPHVHPKVLGDGQLAMYAGDMRVAQGRIEDVTNLSGTFQFDEAAGLLAVADQLMRQGLAVLPQAVRVFPADGSAPHILR